MLLGGWVEIDPQLGCERDAGIVEPVGNFLTLPSFNPLRRTLNDYATQVQSLRPQLMRFARTQLRNEAWAEDAVSETLLAALEKPQSFAGQSLLKTWLVGVLKHKVVDQLRRHAREATALSDDDAQSIDDGLFDNTGHWCAPPQDWGDPQAFCGQRQFLEVMEVCVDQLPPVQGRVFMMREWLELDSVEICRELKITSSNLWVLLHRARLRLRECLLIRWFDHSAPAT